MSRDSLGALEQGGCRQLKGLPNLRPGHPGQLLDRAMSFTTETMPKTPGLLISLTSLQPTSCPISPGQVCLGHEVESSDTAEDLDATAANHHGGT